MHRQRQPCRFERRIPNATRRRERIVVGRGPVLAAYPLLLRHVRVPSCVTVAAGTGQPSGTRAFFTTLATTIGPRRPDPTKISPPSDLEGLGPIDTRTTVIADRVKVVRGRSAAGVSNPLSRLSRRDSAITVDAISNDG